MSHRSDEEVDDLDDLDDYLDEFAEQALSKPPGADLNAPEPSKRSDGSKAAKNVVNEPSVTCKPTKDDPNMQELDEEFAEKLKLGVDYLLEEMDDSPEAKQSLAALLAGMADATGANSNVPQSNAKDTSASTAGGKSEDFHDTIAATMNRLKESRKELDNKAESGTDFLANMMKELEAAAGTDGNGLEALLGELLLELSSKDILYEPMKEMHEKYPKWIEENESKLPADGLARYKTQQRIVAEIVTKFEDPSYSDQDADCKKFITTRMEEMQNSGAAPMELMSDMTSGSIPGLDGLGGAPPKDLEDCAVQ